jgi:hypothetical protein
MVGMIASACGGPTGGDGSSDGDASDGGGSASQESGDEAAEPIAEEDYVATLADLLCELQAECTCDNPLPEAECRDMLAESIGSSSTPSPGSGLVFDPQCAGEVVDDWAQLGCGSIVEMPAPGCSPCPLYHGSRSVGQTCTVFDDGRFDDCDRGLRCGVGNVCGDPCATAGEGEDCGSQSCAPGLFCSYTDPDDEQHGDEPIAECRPAAQLGEACSIDECDAGLVCSYSAECIEWAGAQVGEPCGYGCAAGLQCDTTLNDGAGECRPRGAEGEACIGAADCASGRCHSGTQTCQAEQAAACFG